MNFEPSDLPPSDLPPSDLPPSEPPQSDLPPSESPQPPVINAQINAQTDTADPQSRLQLYAQRLLKAAPAGSEPAMVGPLHSEMGKAHEELGRYTEASIHYRAAAHCFERIENLEQAAQCWLLAGEVQAALGLFEAQNAFERASELGVFLNNLPLQAQAQYSLGGLKESQGDLQGALINYQEAIRLIELTDLSNDPALQALHSDLVNSFAFVQIELMVIQALELAEQINRSAERPPLSSPGDPDERSSNPRGLPRPGGGLPGDPEASRNGKPWPPRSWRR
jgi:tetratricopeptide (TPR) repeat protein